MSKYLEHSESIASYLDGQMTPDQMQEFEKQLHTDPVLRSEFELQQDIIHTLKDFRKSQLKTRLDQVPVSMGPSALMGVKAAAALVISGMIGLGAYLYLNTENDPVESVAVITDPVEEVERPQIEPVEELSEVETTAELQAAESAELKATEAEALVDLEPVSKPEELKSEGAQTPQTAVETPNVAVDNQAGSVEEEQQTPVINSPKLISPDLEETDVEESLEIPSSSLAQEGLAENSVVAVETARRDKELFHYQYYNGKLYLYGDFRDNPYEILELNSSNGKRLFIYYNGDYYRIIDNRQEITPLEKLSDQDIIRKLEIIQANK